MTLYQIINTLKQIALTQPNVKSATDGSVYEVMNANPSVKYNVVHFSQTTHQSDEEFDYYGLNIFYISRLEDSLEDNRLQIQSIGKEILDNIIRTFCENWNIEFPTITYYPFTQKFADLCAGAYCNVRLEVPKEIICADDFLSEVVPGTGIKLQDITVTITENGLRVFTPDAEYDGIGEIRIVTDVPQTTAVLQDKEVEYTENGVYTVYPDPEYDGMTSVSVEVDVDDRYEEGYDDGKQDGIDEQKAKLSSTSFTQNNAYTSENGWSAVTVNVPTGQTINNQYKSDYLTEANFDFNADDPGPGAGCVYELQTGYTYDSGYTGLEEVSQSIFINASGAVEFGKELQKLELSSTSFTGNNTYENANGWSSVTVDVPTGYSQADLDAAYQEGYDDGLNDCGGWDHKATGLTIIAADTIIGSGEVSYSATPRGAIIDPEYSSSDDTIASFDDPQNPNILTVHQNGQVTLCVTDTRTNLQSCKQVNVLVSGSAYGELEFVYLTTEPNQTIHLFNGAAQESSATFYNFYNAIISIVIDGVTVSKSPDNIKCFSVPSNLCWYEETFASAGTHTVKYYLTSAITTLGSLLFSSQDLGSGYTNQLVSANIMSGITGLTSGVFQSQANLTSITLSNSVENLSTFAFQYSGIESIIIPDSVTGITNQFIGSTGYGVFDHCTSLTSVTIGTGCSVIDAYSFQDTGLQNLTINRTKPPTLGQNAFYNVTSLAHIYVPSNSVNTYKTAAGWSDYASIITAIS